MHPTPHPTPAVVHHPTRAPTPCPEWKNCGPKRVRKHTMHKLTSETINRNAIVHSKVPPVTMQHGKATPLAMLRKSRQHDRASRKVHHTLARGRWWDNAISRAVLTHSPAYLALCFALTLALLAFTVARMIATHHYQRPEQLKTPIQLQNREANVVNTFPVRQQGAGAPPRWAEEDDNFVDAYSAAYQMPVPSTYS